MRKKKKTIIGSILLLLLIISSLFAHNLIVNIITGRVHSPKDYIGSNVTMEDSTKFTVLRRIGIKKKKNINDTYAIFIVRFKFKNLKFDTNKRLSIIPAPFLINMKGFREKIWTFNKDIGFFQGIYQWESEALAEKYPESFVFNLMTKRAAPGTISYNVIPNTEIEEYINGLMSDLKEGT